MMVAPLPVDSPSRRGDAVCRERVSALADPRALRARAESVIIELLAYGTPSIERMARRLDMSSRSLGRRLSEQRTSYKALIDGIRRELARRYLARGSHPDTHSLQGR